MTHSLSPLARPERSRRGHRALRIAAVAVCAALTVASAAGAPSAGAAEAYQRISGEGSSWAANAIDAMRVNVRQFGITVDYNPSGSTAGRKNFLNGTVDFAASDIPFQFNPEDGSAPERPAPGSYAYMPITAGGTGFMYNLMIGGKRVTNLRLSGENVAKIFTGVIKVWNDAGIQADNPGLVMPARPIVPVVRSDGSGSTAQFTKWMITTHGKIWTDYCVGRLKRSADTCGYTSFYPTIPGMIAQSGDLGVSGYVSQGFAEGAIGYVNYSYALGAQFPVAKVLNAAGYYTEPTPENVAVALLKARINTDESKPETYLTQNLDGVYTDTDPRSYQLSSYSYLILPTVVAGQFNEAKGRTLGAFAYYAMCQAQQQSASLGYSPMPINLVQASFDQIAKVPGVELQTIDIKSCKNPTFSSDGSNTLAKNAPQPQACDKKGGVTQCPDGTGGLKTTPTAVKADPAASGGTATGGVGGSGGSAGSGTGTGTVTTDPTGSVIEGDTLTTGTAYSDPAAGVVDPDTGESAGPIDDGVVSNLPVGAAVPTALAARDGWGAPTALLLMVALLTIALVLAPAWAMRVFASRGPR